MPNVKDCPGFETFGADVQQAREAVKMSRRELTEKVGIDPRQRTSHKLQLCPEKYLPIVEGVIDGAIKLKDADDEKEDV